MCFEWVCMPCIHTHFGFESDWQQVQDESDAASDYVAERYLIGRISERTVARGAWQKRWSLSIVDGNPAGHPMVYPNYN